MDIFFQLLFDLHYKLAAGSDLNPNLMTIGQRSIRKALDGSC